MSRLLINISKYVILFLMLAYTYVSYMTLGRKKEKTLQRRYIIQNVLTLLIFTICSIILISYDVTALALISFVLELAYLVLLVIMYRLLYPGCSVALVNNMAMLLSLGFVMVQRLAPQNALKQFLIVLVGTVVSFFVPHIMRKRRQLFKLKYIFAMVGIGLLCVTLILGKTTWGANISIDIAGFTFQPSEFVKILYILFVAALLSKAKSFRNILISGIVAAVHVLVLIASNDLGCALIFFVVYIVMLYVASGKIHYLALGILCGCGAAVMAYKLFSHVKTRISAWQNPWAIIDGGGYQITQSLFAIGTGGLFGMGLCQGMPNSIPVAVKDFVYSAIVEEFGLLFGICLILVCFCCYINMMKVALRSRDMYYKLIAVGFGTIYMFQCFLTIGGVTKFIPSTGVTLPFVSYGGSSILCSLMMFAVVQAVFIVVKENEGDETIEDRTKSDTKEKTASGRSPERKKNANNPK